MGASTVSYLISAGTHNGTAFGIVVAYSLNDINPEIRIREQGKMLPSAIAFTEKNLDASVTYMAGASISPIAKGTKGSLSITAKDPAGASKTYSLANAMALSTSINHSDRGVSMITTSFSVEDSGDTTTLSQA